MYNPFWVFEAVTVSCACVFKAKTFEQDDLALSRVAAFFHQESAREQKQAEAMQQYLSERGGHYCNKVIQVILSYLHQLNMVPHCRLHYPQVLPSCHSKINGVHFIMILAPIVGKIIFHRYLLLF